MMTNVFHDWSTTKTENEALSCIMNVAQQYECEAALFSYAPTGWLPTEEPGLIRRTLQSGLHKHLMRDWRAVGGEFDMQLASLNRKFDPVRRRMVSQTLPQHFALQEIIDAPGNQYSTLEKRWCTSLLKLDIAEIISAPVQMPPSEYWNLTLARKSRAVPGSAPSQSDMASLMYFAHGLTHFCIDKLRWRELGQQDKKMQITTRERDCLYWAAKGKSAADTAHILGLKVETVRKYLKTTLAKLNAKTKTQAVVKALQLGLLELSDEI